jgi:hypothetical protein
LNFFGFIWPTGTFLNARRDFFKDPDEEFVVKDSINWLLMGPGRQGFFVTILSRPMFWIYILAHKQ